MKMRFYPLVIVWAFTFSIAQLFAIGGVIGSVIFAPLALKEPPVFPEGLGEMVRGIAIVWFVAAIVQAIFLRVCTPFPRVLAWAWASIQTLLWTLLSLLLYAALSQPFIYFVIFGLMLLIEWETWWIVKSGLGIIYQRTASLWFAGRILSGLSILCFWLIWLLSLGIHFGNVYLSLMATCIPGFLYGLIEAVTLFLPLNQTTMNKALSVEQ